MSGFVCFMASFVASWCVQTSWNSAVYTQWNLSSAKRNRSLFVSDCDLKTQISFINSDVSADKFTFTIWSVYGLESSIILIVCSNPFVWLTCPLFVASKYREREQERGAVVFGVSASYWGFSNFILNHTNFATPPPSVGRLASQTSWVSRDFTQTL
jgi:hypothetical protein